MHEETDTKSMRLDKWLWCARFYKSRKLACDAIKAGKITVNAQKVKPSSTIKPGDQVSIKHTPYHYQVEILSLARQRKSAVEAQKLLAISLEASVG